MSAFVGIYKFARNDNFEDYITKMGVPFVARMAITRSKPDIHIAQEEDGKHWTVRFEAFMTMEMKFELGVEFEDTPPFGGAAHKAVATLEDDGTKLKIASQTEKGEVIRVFSLGDDGKELEVDLKCDERGAHAKRFFMKE